MTNHTTREIAENFINGNISWVKKQLLHDTVATARVAKWLKENVPGELDSFLRIMADY